MTDSKGTPSALQSAENSQDFDEDEDMKEFPWVRHTKRGVSPTPPPSWRPGQPLVRPERFAVETRKPNGSAIGPNPKRLGKYDSEGMVALRVGDTLCKGRYVVTGHAGQGTFGTVVTAHDTKRRRDICLKIIRAVERYRQAGDIEEEILRTLDSKEDNQSFCVRMLCAFDETRAGQVHKCIGFEQLGSSLYEFMKSNLYRGFRVRHIASFAAQLLKGVAFCHSRKLVHTDLKPENILLVDSSFRVSREYPDSGSPLTYNVPLSRAIRIIDFGGATFEDQHHSRIINTRQYRAPEVIMGLEWSYPSDLWCVGCILVELYTGRLLFQASDNLEHIALMEHVLSRSIPRHMIDKALEPYRQRRESERRDRERRRYRSHSRRRGSGRRSRSYSPDRHYRSGRRSGGFDRRRRISRSPRRDRDRDGGRYRRSRSRDYSRRRTRNPDWKESSASDSENDRSSETRADELFDWHTSALRWYEVASRESRRKVNDMQTLEEIVHDHEFRSLLRWLLEVDPNKRATAMEALQHPFLDLTDVEVDINMSRPPAPADAAAAAHSSSGR